jgi:pimeloyl-ACP methyl ester carboxylesterase
VGEADRVVVASDGWRLGVRVLGPPRDRVALLLHAMMVDHRSMDRPAGAGFASQLAAAGWEVWLADLRGRGMSGPTPAEGGTWRYDDVVLRDIPALAAAAGGRRVALVGQSLGAHAGIAAAALGAPIDAAVLVAANIWLPGLEPNPAVRAAKRAANRALAAVTRARGRFPSRTVGMGPAEEARPYIDDLVGFWKRGWVSADGRVDYLTAVRGWGGPALAVIGAGDVLMGRPDAAAAWAANVGPRGAETWLVGDGRYGVEGRPGHMGLITEAAYAGWWPRMATWLEGAVPG